MAASKTKTLILILLVLCIIWICLRLTPMLFTPLGILGGPVHFFRSWDISEIGCWPGFFQPIRLHGFLPLILLVLWIAIIVWVYRDAERRGMNGVLWALLVFIGNLIGLIIYLIIRTEEMPVARSAPADRTCPGCGDPVNNRFVFCPACGRRLHNICPGCGKPAEANWKVCPHCGEGLHKDDKKTD
jgi:hypothetical protein